MNLGAEDGGAEEIAVVAEGVVEEGVEGFKNKHSPSEVSVSSVALVLFCHQSISQRSETQT